MRISDWSSDVCSSDLNQGPTSGLTPHIAIADKRASEAIDFYKKAFGATELTRIPADDGVRLMHAHLTINGASLMMHDEFPEYVSEPSGKPDGVTLHLQRSEERRVGKECGSPGRSRWSPYK